KEPSQVAANLALPGGANRAILQQIEDTRGRLALEPSLELATHRLETERRQLLDRFGKRRIEILVEIRPACARRRQDLPRLLLPLADQLGARYILQLRIVDLAEHQLACEQLIERIEQLQLVLERQLDVDALDRIGVVTHALERNHHVLVYLEGVRVAGNRRSARTIQPELPARIGADGEDPLSRAAVRNANHLGGGAGNGRLVVSDD